MGVQIAFTAVVTCDICGKKIVTDTRLGDIAIRSPTASNCIAAPELIISNHWETNSFFSDHPSYVYCEQCGEIYKNRLKELKVKHEQEMKSARYNVTEEVRKSLTS